MWNQKISMSVYNHYSIPTAELVPILKQIGFDGISPEWEKDVDLSPVFAAASACDMAIVSLHAPYLGAADMWHEEETVFLPALTDIFFSLEVCRAHSIPVLVCHTWIGFEKEPTPTKAGLSHWQQVVDKAKEYGVKIAFENTEGEEHLFALMNHFKGNDTVGFCWDSGHEMCYNHSKDMLTPFADRLLLTHLNDNLGIRRFDGETFWHDDLHLLPYDGIADWEDNILRLKKANRLTYLNFELNIRSKPNRFENAPYEKMSLCEYFSAVYVRACRIASRYAK